MKLKNWWVAVTAGFRSLKGSMRKSKSQLKVVVSNGALSTQLTDTSANSGESSRWSRLAAVRRAWQRQFRPRYVEVSEMTLTELRSIEARVRKALYP